MIKGSCPCGAVTVTAARRPDYLNSCNCSMCFRLGTLTGYFDPAEVTIAGPTRSFVRGDIDPQCLTVPFCPDCGATVGWTSLEPLDPPRMGVNMRLFGPEALLGIPVRFTDGANWDESSPRPARRHEDVVFEWGAPF